MITKKNKFLIIYPCGHGGNFISELFSLGNDTFPAGTSPMENRVESYACRYTPTNWLDNETSDQHGRSSRRFCFDTYNKIDIISRHPHTALIINKHPPVPLNVVSCDAYHTAEGRQWGN